MKQIEWDIIERRLEGGLVSRRGDLFSRLVCGK